MLNKRFQSNTTIRQQNEEHYINLHIDQLDNLLTTCPIDKRWEIVIKPDPNWQFGCIDSTDRQCGDYSLSTRMGTRVDGPVPLLTQISLVLRHKLRVRLQATQCSKGSDAICFETTIILIRLMITLYRSLCSFSACTCWKWGKIHFRSNHHCIVFWLYCWARCWMLQDMDHMEASCIFYVKVGMFDQLEQSKICVLTVTTLGMIMLTVQHNLIFSLCFMKDPGDFLRQTSPVYLSIEEFPSDMIQQWDLCCHSCLCIPVKKESTMDRHSANSRTVSNTCNRQRYAVGFILRQPCMLADTHSIFTWS